MRTTRAKLLSFVLLTMIAGISGCAMFPADPPRSQPKYYSSPESSYSTPERTIKGLYIKSDYHLPYELLGEVKNGELMFFLPVTPKLEPVSISFYIASPAPQDMQAIEDTVQNYFWERSVSISYSRDYTHYPGVVSVFIEGMDSKLFFRYLLQKVALPFSDASLATYHAVFPEETSIPKVNHEQP